MRTLALISILVLTSSVGLAAAPTALATVPNENCASSPSDPWERPASTTRDSIFFGNKCVNTASQRTPELWPESPGDDRHLLTVTNIQHENQFWTAYVPVDDDAIESVNFLFKYTKNILVYAGHGQLLIHFKKPVVLRLQTDPNVLTVTHDLMYTVEGALTVGQKTSVMLGVFGLINNYPVVQRIATLEQRLLEDGADYPHFSQYPMQLRDGEKSQLVQLLLESASRNGLRRFYNSLERNCVSVLMEIIDQLPRMKAANYPPYHFRRSIDPVMGVVLRDLQDRELIDATPVIFSTTNKKNK